MARALTYIHLCAIVHTIAHGRVGDLGKSPKKRAKIFCRVPRLL
jgi:hypothetical protein